MIHDRYILAWHNRPAHAGTQEIILQLISYGEIPQLKCRKTSCEHLLTRKYQNMFSGSLTKALKPVHLHVDVKGNINPDSHSIHGSFVALTVERSRLVMDSSLKAKGGVCRFILSAVRLIECHSGNTVKSRHFDGGGEFQKEMISLNDESVIVGTTKPYTSFSSGLAERRNGIILSLALTSLF